MRIFTREVNVCFKNNDFKKSHVLACHKYALLEIGEHVMALFVKFVLTFKSGNFSFIYFVRVMHELHYYYYKLCAYP